jgi:hypothetical protein
MDPNGDTSADADPQLPWPRSGDQLFGPDEDWDNNACINFTFDRFNLYARGYLQAAELMIETIVNTRRSPDAVVYPIAFLYRHYLELRLKKIITEGRELLGLRVEFPKRNDYPPGRHPEEPVRARGKSLAEPRARRCLQACRLRIFSRTELSRRAILC